MEKKENEFKLDTSFDLLRTDGIKFDSVDSTKEEPEEKIENKETKIKDMKSIFQTANDSVSKASEILNKNIELNKKLKEKAEVLGKEKKELETKTNEFKLHKEALAKQVELLKQKQTEFEMYKITEKKKIESHLKDIEDRELRLKQEKEDLEDIKRNIELDRSKCEAEKDELANNLSKFNELVSEFSSGIDRFNKIDDMENI